MKATVAGGTPDVQGEKAPLRVRRPSVWKRGVAALRARCWSAAFTLVGSPICVTGQRPDGACVLVANHSSHADAPAMLAALGGAPAPVVAAAADYWFTSVIRRLACRVLINGFAVRRGNGGTDDLHAAVEMLRAGRSVVVFAEGSRSRDGQLGRFRSGAFRLAAAAAVPVVPVALVGTGDLLPVHGELRRASVEVRFGQPMLGSAPSDARNAVLELLAHGPARPRQGRVWRVVSGLAQRPAGPAVLAVWGFAEALAWPVLAEFALVCLAGAARARRVPILVAALAAGSVIGVVVHVILARHGVTLPAPWTTGRMRRTAEQHVAASGPWALWSQVNDGIPVKVYAQAFGRTGVPVWQIAGVAALTRTIRMVAVGAAVAVVGRLARRVLPACYGIVLAAFAVSFFVGLAFVETSWR